MGTSPSAKGAGISMYSPAAQGAAFIDVTQTLWLTPKTEDELISGSQGLLPS